MIVEIHGLEVFGRHGVGEAERATASRSSSTSTLELAEPHEDAIDATVDYRAVRDAVREVSDAQRVQAARVARRRDGGRDRHRVFAVDAVTVRVRKPGIAWAEWTAATASRARRS